MMVQSNEPHEPIMVNNVDILKIKPRGSVSQVGLAVARHLWSDDELTAGQLLKLRAKGRPPLSPVRSNLFKSNLSVLY